MMMRNRPDFHWLDTAAQFLRITPVSIYNSSSIEEIAYLSTHCEAQAAILEDAGFLEKFLKIRGEIPTLQHIAVMDASLATGDVMSLGTLMDTEPLDVDELAAQTSPDDLATMIYTSGTTGRCGRRSCSTSTTSCSRSRALALHHVRHVRGEEGHLVSPHGAHRRAHDEPLPAGGARLHGDDVPGLQPDRDVRARGAPERALR